VEKVTEMASGFAQAGYVVLRGFVPEPARAFLYEYALKSVKAGRLRIGDSTMADTPNFYCDPFTDTLLELLLPRMETETGLMLFPTYSYFRVYKHGDVLKRHQDRYSCEISATLNLGRMSDEPWPIWVEVEGVARNISLEPGDAMLYRGIEIPHWRESFSGEHSAQVFLHYVDQNGQHKDLIYDGRKSLSTSPMSTHLMEQLMGSSISEEGKLRSINR
jgi:hypothetical protein